MNQNEMVQLIAGTINRVLADRGEAWREIPPDTPVLGGDLPFDSLDLAAMVVELDEVTGKSPFAAGFIHFQTVGELAALYASAAK